MAPADLSGRGAELIRKACPHAKLFWHCAPYVDEQDCQGDIGVPIGASDDKYILFFYHSQ